MSTAEESIAAKKRIMFIKGEDFNYIAYHILVVLDSLNCYSEANVFRDHRKLAYLTDLVSSQSLARMLVRRNRLDSKLSQRDAHSLQTAYANGISRQHLVSRVIASLVSRGILSVKQGEKDSLELDVWLNKNKLPKSFLESDLYATERENLRLLLSISNRLRTVMFPTFLERYFSDHGVHTWHS
jgi:hypothetical protein